MVPAFYYELHSGQHLAHFGKSSLVVAEKVRTNERVELREVGPWDEDCHRKRGTVLDMS